jgi:hypothetical protein
VSTVVRAKTAFAHPGPDGYPRTVNAGALFDSEDPCVKKYAQLFEPVEVEVSRRASARSSETASAAPGERRARSTRTTSKADTSEETGS